MADNFIANAGAGGDTFAADDIALVKYPRSKITIGADGVNDGDVSSSNPMPVTGTVAVTNAGLTELAAAINGSVLDVNIANSSGGTIAISNTGLTELAAALFVDDAAFTVAVSQVAAVGGIVTSDAVDSGDIGAFAMLANRQQKVTLYDSAGVEMAVGGGTQYTEDAAAAANPVGNAMIVVREDARAGSLTTTDGDNVALRGNNLGELYVKHTDAIAVTNAGLTELAGAINASAQMDVNIVASSATIAISNAGLTELAAAIYAEDVGASAADPGIAILAVRRDADTTLVDTTGDYANLQVDANGYLKVEIFDGGASHTVDNNGTFLVQIDGAALTALQLLDDTIKVDDAAFTPAVTSVSMAGFEADETGTDSVDEGDAGAARMTLDRKLIVNAQPHTAGGLSIARDIDLDNGTLTVVKASAGQLYGMTICNTGTVTAFVKFYNATSGTLGTGTPVMTIGIPGNTSDDTLFSQMYPLGVAFATGICVGAGTGVADADNTDPGTNVVVANIFYM